MKFTKFLFKSVDTKDIVKNILIFVVALALASVLLTIFSIVFVCLLGFLVWGGSHAISMIQPSSAQETALSLKESLVVSGGALEIGFYVVIVLSLLWFVFGDWIEKSYKDYKKE